MSFPFASYFNNLSLDKETDPHHNHRLQLAGPTLSIRCMMTFDEKRTQEAFSYCRLAVANQEELADIQVSHLDQRTFVEVRDSIYFNV